jgi:hypothetical protein
MKAYGSGDTSLTRNPERIGGLTGELRRAIPPRLREDLPSYGLERETHPHCGSSSVCFLYVNATLRFSFGQFRAYVLLLDTNRLISPIREAS